MENISVRSSRWFLLVVAVIGWLAILLQLYLIIANRTASIAETVVRFFSFFTILTNLLVAICCSAILSWGKQGIGRSFSKPATLTAITLYIVVVGMIYNLILRFQWEPKGLQRIVDELLHSVIPVLFFVYWLLFVPKQTLAWKHIAPWLVYPVIYCVFILIRGSLSGYYPYPFIAVSTLGYSRVLVNICGLVIMFLAISVVLVSIAKLRGKKTAAVD